MRDVQTLRHGPQNQGRERETRRTAGARAIALQVMQLRHAAHSRREGLDRTRRQGGGSDGGNKEAWACSRAESR
eukprot:2922427-Pleurochrysis_carterae.AAC.1